MDWNGTIIGGCLGFIAAIIPAVIDIIRSHYQNKQDVEKAEVGIPPATIVEAPPEEDHWSEKFLEFVRASVRPVVTYMFFGLFVLIKVVGLVKGLLFENISVVVLLPAIWDTETSSLFAAVISFWFGSRAAEVITEKNQVRD